MAITNLKALFSLDIGNLKSGLGQIQTSMKTASEGLKSVADETKQATAPLDGLKDGLVSVGKLVATAFAIDKIKDFGVASIEAAASAEAIQAQFDQTFKGLGKEAQSSVESLGKEFGMLPNRIKPAFTQTTAQFKGLGMDTAAAMEQASKATTIAADASAFFDTTMESAQGSLNSFIKGNYEGGEAIGIFANDSQMAAYAVKTGAAESTKAWAGMEEAQKQVIRLDFAKNMQESAGAAGQAAREMDGYENVMGNVKQVWTDFKAIVGAPMLDVAIEGLKKVIEIGQSAGEKIKYLQDNWESLKQVLIPVGVLIGGLALAFGLYSIQQTMAAAGTTIWSVVAGIGATATAAFGAAMAFLTSPITLVVMSIAAIIAIGYLLFTHWEELGTFASIAWEAIKSGIAMAWEGIKSVISGAVEIVKTVISATWEGIKGVTSAIWNGIASVLSGVWSGIKSLISNAVNVIGSVITSVWNTIKAVTSAIWNGIKAVIAAVWNGIKSLITSAVNGVKNTITTVWNAIKSVTSTVWNGIKSAMTKPVEAASNVIKGIIDKIKGFFSGLKLKFPSIGMPPLPHFSLTGKFSLKPPSVPKLGVSWYKTGGIFTDDSVIGVGEDGAEAVLPLSNKGRMKPFAQAVSSMLDIPEGGGSGDGGNQRITIEVPVNLDRREIAKAVAPNIEKEIQAIQEKEARKGGRR